MFPSCSSVGCRGDIEFVLLMGNLLDVSVYEYVDKEEHDAKLLFSGMLLKEYHVNKDTGEIEEIQ